MPPHGPGPKFNGERPTLTVVAGIDLRCTGTLRRGGRCKNRVVPGYDACAVHGGGTSLLAERFKGTRRRKGSLPGDESPHFKTGRYSKLLPERLHDRYELARDDPALLVLEEEIHLVDVRIQTLTQQLDQGESGALWREARQAVRDLFTAFRSKDYAAAFPIIQDMRTKIEGGLAEAEAWNELGRWIDRRKQLAESERKRYVELQQYIPVSRVNILIKAIGGVIQQHVTDPVALSNIAADLGKVLSGGVTGRLDASRLPEDTFQDRPGD